MASPRSAPLLFLLLLTLSTTSSSALTCTTQKLTDATNSNKLYANCVDLPRLNSFLHWTHDPTNSSLSVAFVAQPPKPGGWVSWAINPTGTGMAGSQALVAYKDSGAVAVKTLDIKSYSSMVPGKLSFDVWGLRAEEVGGVIRLFANVKVPEKAKSVNQVWQVGPSVTAGRIDAHSFAPENLNSVGTLSLNGGQSAVGDHGLDSRTKRKNIHGILNAVSWGFLFPLGVIIARYLRTFPSADPAWFYLHVACQLSAYVIGVAGWGTGLKLGSESVGIVYSVHRNIGIALFCLCTIQIFALFIRPKKDHKYRLFWNIYHHSFGYTIIVLGIINIFKGFDILSPEKKWKTVYIIAIVALGVIALLLEVATWIVVLKRKSSTKTYDGYNNGQNRQGPLNN